MKTMPQARTKTPISPQQYARLQGDYDALQRDHAALKRQHDHELASLKQQLAWLKRQLFGPKSEKRLIDEAVDQKALFETAGESAEVAPTESISYTRKKAVKERGNAVTDSGLRFSEDVPVEVIRVADPEIEAIPEQHRIVIGEKVTHRLAQRPGSYVILQYVRPVIKDLRDDHVHTTPAPANVLEGSLADVSLLAGLMVDKFCYHLPLYRQHQRLATNGITVSRSTLTNLVKRAVQLLEPVYDAQLEQVLQSKVLAMDETPIKAGRSKTPGRKGKMKQAWFWPVYGQDDEVCFVFSPTRASRVVTDTLGKHFSGTLITDGYAAYARYAQARPEITHANCWAHARRKFDAALGDEPKAADQALELIGQLYRIEAQITDQALTGRNKLGYRSQHALPVVQAFWAWCEQHMRRMDRPKTSLLRRAANYALSRKASLEVFLSDPEVPIDTNHLERALRPIPMGKKNWLFSWTELGARDIGTIQSLLVTCRIHGINPYTYLVDVLQRVGQHPASKVEQLTPRLWKEHFASKPLVSDVQWIDQ